MQSAASAGLLGNASLLTATYGKICVESNCIAIGSRVRRAGSDQATMTTIIQGYRLQD